MLTITTAFALFTFLGEPGNPTDPPPRAASMQMRIPNPGTTTAGGTNYPIKQVKLILDVVSPGGAPALEFTVEQTSPAGGFSQTITAPTTAAGEESAVDGDEVVVHLVEDLFGDARRYQLWFFLETNYQFSAALGEDENTMTADETWQVSVNGTNDIQAACVQTLVSIDTVPTPIVGATTAITTAPAEALDASGDPWPDACSNERPPIALMLVLDKSGSMGWSTGDSRPRIDILRDAVEDLVAVWQDIDDPADQVGIVFFDGDHEDFDDLTPGLNAFSTNASNIADGETGTTSDNIRDVTPGGSTSIGDGVIRAADFLAASTAERRVILVMSDGKQNADKLIAVDSGFVYTHPPADPVRPADGSADLPGQDDPDTPEVEDEWLQIYAMTTGPAGYVDEAINQAMAEATRGFYVNSELDSEELRLFFLEMLQNFLRFNTVEAVMLEKRTVPRGGDSFSFPLTGGTTRVAVDLMFDRSHGVLGVELVPPGGQPIKATGSGSIRLRPTLQNTANGNSFIGTWTARVTIADPTGGTPPTGVPYMVTVLADDRVVRTDFEVQNDDLFPGETIEVRVQPRAAGKKLGSLPSGSVKVIVGNSEQSIYDLLLESQASTTPPVPGDAPSSAGDSQIENLLEGENSYSLAENEIVLSPDGNGGYAATIPIGLAGHYAMLFTVEAEVEGVGTIRRQQIRTAYVLAYPDPEETAVTTTVSAAGGTSTLNVSFTPITAAKQRLGRHWGPRFWLTTPTGPPIGVRDGNDGSYSAAVPFTGNEPPAVALHFLDKAVLVSSSTPPAKIAELLDPAGSGSGGGTVLISNVNEPTTPLPNGVPPWIWLLLILLLVIIVFIALKRRAQTGP